MAGFALCCGLPPGPDFADCEALAVLAPPNERRLLAIDGCVGNRRARRAESGTCEHICTPSGPDVARALRAFAAAHPKARE